MSLILPVNQAALAEIDALSEEFGKLIAYDVCDIVGVLIGLKPAAFIGGNRQDIGVGLVEKLGLKHAQWPEKHLVYVSAEQELASRLSELHKIVWGNNATFLDENREIGKLLGYPETATEYFLKRLPTLATDNPLPYYLPEGIEGTVSEYFYQLVLSPEHYKKEVAAYCQPIEEAVREFAPKTYAVLCALSSRS